MKVCWLTSVAAPYTIRLFEQIARSIDLCVVMDDKKEANRNSEWKLDERNDFRIYRIDNDYSRKIRELASEYDILIDGLYLSRYGYQAVSEFKKRGKKVAMAADGGIARNRGFLINGIMSYLMKRHDRFLSSSEFTDKYFVYYGVDPEKIFHYRFTSLDQRDIEENKKYSSNRVKLRRELQIDDRYTMISVGQPIRRKGYDILVRAYLESGLSDEINLYIVGGEPEKHVEEYVRQHKLKNVHFVGLLKKTELNQYYGASDSFILCTREDIWGLVIEEAMSFGLPVITSDECVAGLHFGRLSENVLICRSEDISDFAEKIRLLHNRRCDSEEIEKDILDCIAPYTIENSSEDIINVFSLL